MTAVKPPLVRITARTADILRRCYRGEIPAEVLEQMAVLKATADGHLDAAGRIKRGGGRVPGRRS
ncbi:hypothetical protein ACFZAR_05460 [Streptomyces sp. NPDC008222]|uniref:hypothetical protein n=1 Tax=Streptomyces sp. NPDC008222 TaxID=3364820 RepID=UPI0036EC4973